MARGEDDDVQNRIHCNTYIVYAKIQTNQMEQNANSLNLQPNGVESVNMKYVYSLKCAKIGQHFAESRSCKYFVVKEKVLYWLIIRNNLV
ncbi:hypothetical protein BLOT_004644 [Blomia tropicalis]|nr:hypothetical protein BLOT_004644 [Blomia tropicalis]